MYFAPNTDQGFLDAVSTAVHDATNKPSSGDERSRFLHLLYLALHRIDPLVAYRDERSERYGNDLIGDCNWTFVIDTVRPALVPPVGLGTRDMDARSLGNSCKQVRGPGNDPAVPIHRR